MPAAKKLLPRRLRSRTQYGSACISCRQLVDALHARFQKSDRYHLRFIKHDYAVRYIVKLPAFRRLVMKQGFKKLHVSRHDNRPIPIFCCQPLHRTAFVCIIIHDVHMMFYDVLLSQYVFKHGGILLDDARIRNHINDAPLFHPASVVQRKGHRGNRLASARRDRQRIQRIGSRFAHSDTLTQYICTLALNFCMLRFQKLLYISIQSLLQRI